MADYSKALEDAVREYLDKEEFRYEFDAEKGRFSFGMNLKSQLNSCRVFVHIRKDSILCRGVSPINISEKARPQVAEYLTRANYGLLNGNFEMDYSDGEVIYKTFLKCGSLVPDLSVIESTVDMPFIMLRRYGDGMLAVMYGGKDPEAAVKEAEDDD